MSTDFLSFIWLHPWKISEFRDVLLHAIAEGSGRVGWESAKLVVENRRIEIRHSH